MSIEEKKIIEDKRYVQLYYDSDGVERNETPADPDDSANFISEILFCDWPFKLIFSWCEIISINLTSLLTVWDFLLFRIWTFWQFYCWYFER